MLSKIKLYAIAALTFLATLFYALFQREKSKRLKEQVDDYKVRESVLVQAQENISKATQEGRKREQDNISKINNGDWSGFNDGV